MFNFFKEFLTSKKELSKQIESLKIELDKLHTSKFEEYFNENTYITTHDGLALEFRGKQIVSILASSFWELVADSDNYIICDLNSSDGKSVEVTIKKRGKLSPQDKLNNLKKLIPELLDSCDKSTDSYKKVVAFLENEAAILARNGK